MAAKNKVTAGDYKGKSITKLFGQVSIAVGFTKSLAIDKSTVDSYEVVDEAHRKSAVSAVGRGLVGGLILGPVGLLAGLSAKSKGVHTLAIQFKDGKRSLIEVDEKIFKVIIEKCFK